MDPATLLALGVLSSAFGLSAYSGMQDRQNQLTELENARNRQHDINMFNRQVSANERFWNMNNAYNSPINQVARYRAAGLNPAIMAGTGQVGSGTSSLASVSGGSSTPGQVAPQDIMANGIDAVIGNGLGFTRDLANQFTPQGQANVDNTNSDSIHKLSGVAEALTRMDVNKSIKAMNEENTKWIGRLNKANINLMNKQAWLADSHTTNQDILNMFQGKLSAANIANIEKSTAMMAAQIGALRASSSRDWAIAALSYAQKAAQDNVNHNFIGLTDRAKANLVDVMEERSILEYFSTISDQNEAERRYNALVNYTNMENHPYGGQVLKFAPTLKYMLETNWPNINLPGIGKLGRVFK